MPIADLLNRVYFGLRWRLGFRVAAPDLESRDSKRVAAYYQSRITDCSFLTDPNHYEWVRVDWILKQVSRGHLLEIGCGNGGMTLQMAPQVDSIVALDVSTPSLAALDSLRIPNVQTVECLIEKYIPTKKFDWIIISEVIEHLTNPRDIIQHCAKWLSPGGSMLVTTPNGHWESNEHLQEYSLATFTALFMNADAERVEVGYLRDKQNCRRWLVGKITAPETPPAPDDFSNRRIIAQKRRSS